MTKGGVFVVDAGRPLTEFPSLVAAANTTARRFPDVTVPDLLDAAAAAHPHRPALRTTAGVTVTHAELAGRSRHLASKLAGLGVRRNDPVAVLVDHLPESVTAIIAVVRAGGFYVPIDLRWPVSRAVDVVSAVGAHVLVVSPSLRRRAFEIAASSPSVTHVVHTPEESADRDKADGLDVVAETWDAISAASDPLEAAGFNLDQHGHRYDAQQVDDYVRHVVALALARYRPGSRLVEIGAGSGLLARELVRHVTQLLAVDPAAGAMTRLAQHATATGERINTACAFAHEVDTVLPPLGDTTVVLLSSTVQYFPDVTYLRGVLHQLMTVLPAGATIVVADLIDPLSGQFDDGLRLPPRWWPVFIADYPGATADVLHRNAANLDSPLRYRYDVLLTVPDTVPATPPPVPLGHAERPSGWADLPSAAVSEPPRATDLIYTISTSGSTGVPKAVAVRHRSVVNLIDWFNRRNNVTADDLGLQVAAYSFDLSVYDMFGLLSAGACLLLLTAEELAEPDRVIDALLDHRVTVWNSAPAAFSLLLPFLRMRPAQHRDSLRRVFLSGDWVPLSMPTDLAVQFPRAGLVVLGGATEACVWSNDFSVSAVDCEWASIPYGHPMQNARYYVLRPDGSPCDVDEPGELYIAGECVADGYLNDPALTSKRFLADPWFPGQRMYRTGDRARWTPHGWVEFLGRLDHQVKVRGFRIELGEIEQATTRLPGVAEAVAVTLGDPRDPELGLVVRTSARLDERTVVEHLRARLPTYMVPARIAVVDGFPVTGTGKVDRGALAEWLRPAIEPTPPAPNGDALGIVCHEFARMLKLDLVQPSDDFFDIGGDSLRAVRLVALLRARHKMPFDVGDIFAYPTPEGLVALLTSGSGVGR
jgi:amino acid adenylation domain-containing protein